MKSAANGGLNLSVLDGWWVEGYDGENGWKIDGNAPEGEDEATRDARHAHAPTSSSGTWSALPRARRGRHPAPLARDGRALALTPAGRASRPHGWSGYARRIYPAA